MMKTHRAWKFELDPNNKIRTLLFKHAGTARFAWNWSLARRIERFHSQDGKDKFTNSMDEHKDLVVLKTTEFPWMYEVSKCAPQEALRNLDKAFKNFWKHRKEGVGFPKFKKRGVSRDSFYLQNNPIKVQDHYIQLPKLGYIRVKERIRNRIKGRILSAIVSRTADRWFVSISVVEDLPEPTPIVGPVVGVDLGLKTFAVLSDGVKLVSPRPFKGALTRLKRAQQSHSRKQKGSSNRRKASLKVAKIHARVANIRKDFLHKITTRLAKTKSTIVIEDLKINALIKNRSLSRSISDAGWGEFRRQLEYKTAWYGSKLVVADRWFPSSKICSDCGFKLRKLPLSVRGWDCPMCGVVHDRDLNAAINLERLMYPEFPGRTLRLDRSEKPVEIPLMETLITKVVKVSQGSKKQEANIGVIQ
jgi:putative transposase